jgi:hypothetical protein
MVLTEGLRGAGKRFVLAVKDDYTPLEEKIPPSLQEEDPGPPADELIEAISQARAKSGGEQLQTSIKVYKKGDIEVVWSERRQSPMSLSYNDVVDYDNEVYSGRTIVTFDSRTLSARTHVSDSDEVIPLYMDERDVSGLAALIKDAAPLDHYDPFALPQPEHEDDSGGRTIYLADDIAA